MEKKLLGQLIDLLPPYQYFRQCFSTTMKNWLPFYWAGFQATVRYTYRIEDLSDLDRVQHGFQEHVRRGIRKARKVRGGEPRPPARRAASPRRCDVHATGTPGAAHA